MFSRDPLSDPTPRLNLNLTIEILAKPKSSKPLSSLCSDETEMVIFENMHKAELYTQG